MSNPVPPRPTVPPPAPSRRLRLGPVLLTLLLCAAIGFGTFWPGSRTVSVSVDVEEGLTARDVAQRLKEQGAVASIYPFLFWVRARNASPKIRVGRYRFGQGRSAFLIVNDLIAGRTEKVKLTVPEGFASWQIAERLDALQISNGAEFRQIVAAEKLEGRLFPATYEMEIGQKAATVAHRMVREFDERWTPELDARAQDVGMTKNDVVTLASIVEREVRVREELPLVAAVYLNRLRKNMKLDADPTVQFALGEWRTRLTYADYRNTRSPYNTYLNPGLPPGPICSPGEDAIRAVLWPAESNALFFVAGEDGRHIFSATYREHVNQVNRRNRKNKTRSGFGKKAP